jgi:hypothetical protein
MHSFLQIIHPPICQEGPVLCQNLCRISGLGEYSSESFVKSPLELPEDLRGNHKLGYDVENEGGADTRSGVGGTLFDNIVVFGRDSLVRNALLLGIVADLLVNVRELEVAFSDVLLESPSEETLSRTISCSPSAYPRFKLDLLSILVSSDA